MAAAQVVCNRCGARTGLDARVWRCTRCGGPQELDVARPLAADIDEAQPGLWRYAPWFPVPVQVGSLGEVTTPIVSVAWSGLSLICKQEGLLPTGSFKDRGSAVMVSWLAGQGVDRIVEDSSGNAGASVAAYAARAGIACTVYVPASASAAKLVQAEVYGARVVRVPGPRAAAEAAAIEAATADPGAVYTPHAFTPFFLEGTRTFAYEVAEQCGDELPDAVVLPVGAGTLLLGVHRGFSDLHAAGRIARIPRLYGVQARACAPLAEAAAQGRDEPVSVSPTPSLAEGIAIAAPVRGRAILAAAAKTGGGFAAVTEDSIWSAFRRLAATGLFVEPTTAAAVAGVDRLVEERRVRREERVLVALTGTGLKASATVAARWAQEHDDAGTRGDGST